MLVVAMARFGVQFADAKPAGSVAEDGRVDRTVRQCKCCQANQRGLGLSPRQMVRLPIEVVKASMFMRKSPVEICPHCDGGALDSAMKAHERRKSDS